MQSNLIAIRFKPNAFNIIISYSLSKRNWVTHNFIDMWMYVFGRDVNMYVVVQFYPWFKFYFPLFWVMVMCDNEFETKENKI